MGGNGTGKSVSPGQVFVDTNPATKPEHKFKLNVLRSGAKRGAYVYCSADGFRFEVISGPHIPFSDSQAVIFFEPALAKCKCSRSLCVFFRSLKGRGCTDVVYFRTHVPNPDGAVCHGGAHSGRSVGRLEVADLSEPDWGVGDHVEAHNTTVFNVDSMDSPCEDVYTNAATRIADATFL